MSLASQLTNSLAGAQLPPGRGAAFKQAASSGSALRLPSRPQRQLVGSIRAAAGASRRSGRSGGSGRAEVPVVDPAAAEELAGQLAEEREQSAAAAAALSEEQQQQVEALAAAISKKLEAVAESDSWTPGVLCSTLGAAGCSLCLCALL